MSSPGGELWGKTASHEEPRGELWGRQPATWSLGGNYGVCVCVCARVPRARVRVCARACVRARVRVCVCVCTDRRTQCPPAVRSIPLSRFPYMDSDNLASISFFLRRYFKDDTKAELLGRMPLAACAVERRVGSRQISIRSKERTLLLVTTVGPEPVTRT